MAKSEFITVSPETSYLVNARADRGGFIGCNVYDLGNGKFEIYGGNRGERDEIIRIINMMETGGKPAATDKQKSFLRNLIDRDYGTATTVGCADVDFDKLSKEEASRFIELMLNS